MPLGYALAHALVGASGEAVGLSIAFVFPAACVVLAHAGTLLVALPVMLAPRRAVLLKPGEALRYA